MIIQLKRSITDLKLEELNYFELNQQEQEKADELYQKDEYEEAIKLLDEALINDPKHISSFFKQLLWLKNYNDAIIWADKTLFIDQKHVNSLYTKADCLKMIGNYNDAITWAGKALFINQKHINSLSIKAESLRRLRNYMMLSYGQIKLFLSIPHISTHYLQKLNLQEGLGFIMMLLYGLIKHCLLIQIMSTHHTQKLQKSYTIVLADSLKMLGNYNDAITIG
ncbi:unnamed protein product [Paramecium sonneborni]|uniref:Tetratricopeptide repeat protein n=1 Tax=Paramecium sonneborni TaxID=65129 RepID=A0A8S1L8E8_9CILI|nr:unnamed protein product [Paramecium sonneborni]